MNLSNRKNNGCTRTFKKVKFIKRYCGQHQRDTATRIVCVIKMRQDNEGERPCGTFRTLQVLLVRSCSSFVSDCNHLSFINFCFSFCLSCSMACVVRMRKDTQDERLWGTSINFSSSCLSQALACLQCEIGIPVSVCKFAVSRISTGSTIGCPVYPF